MPRALMTPGEVADLFSVDAKTVTRWAEKGLIRSIKTPGGHTRFFQDEIHALLEREGPVLGRGPARFRALAGVGVMGCTSCAIVHPQHRWADISSSRFSRPRMRTTLPGKFPSRTSSGNTAELRFGHDDFQLFKSILKEF